MKETLEKIIQIHEDALSLIERERAAAVADHNRRMEYCDSKRNEHLAGMEKAKSALRAIGD